MTMTDGERAEEYELGYIEGHRRTASNLLLHAMGELSGFLEVPNEANLLAERTETIATLRRLLHDLGDDDWPDNLHLSDIIEKHLVPALGGLDK